MFWRAGLGLLFCHAAVVAQMDAQIGNSVTVTASQEAGQPDSVVFSVAVTSGFNQTLEDVVNAVSSLGITAANLIGLGSPTPSFQSLNPPLRPGPPEEQWTFQLVAPFVQMKSTSAALAALQKSIAAGLSLSWTVTGTETSAAVPAGCNIANLAAQASAQAQQIAGAASVKLGAISELSISTSACSLTASYALSTAQPGPRILTATASQPIANGAPDQVLVDISVTSPLIATLSGVMGALTKAGISGTTFVGVTQSSQPSFLGPTLTWTFTETVPLAKLASTLAQLTEAGRSFSAGRLAFGPNGVSYSQPPSCPETGLLSKAQALAQNIAAASGGSAGPLLSLLSGLAAGAAQQRSGNFTALLPNFSAVPILPPAVLTSCSLTAQFQLL